MVPYPDGVETFPGGEFLKGCAANYTSQFGEDGLIEKALEKLGTANQWCFEVGASDGLFFSNTARLREKHWKTVLIEGDAEKYVDLQKFQSDSVFCIPKRINEKSLDQILESLGAPANLDFGVIDIDGQDYWAWWGMRRHIPRLMLLEFEYKSEPMEARFPELGGLGQANYQAILNLGAEKGYRPLAKTHCNILFCRSELLA